MRGGGEAEGRGEGRGEVGRGDNGKGIAEFRSKVERLFVKSKLAGPGPWEELASKLQITQAERDLMATFESASLSERLNIFRKVIFLSSFSIIFFFFYFVICIFYFSFFVSFFLFLNSSFSM